MSWSRFWNACTRLNMTCYPRVPSKLACRLPVWHLPLWSVSVNTWCLYLVFVDLLGYQEEATVFKGWRFKGFTCFVLYMLLFKYFGQSFYCSFLVFKIIKKSVTVIEMKVSLQCSLKLEACRLFMPESLLLKYKYSSIFFSSPNKLHWL